MYNEIIKQLSNKLFPGSGIINVSPLKGMTNDTFSVTLDCGKYVFRLPTEISKQIINRSDEKISAKLAYDLGLDSEIIYFEEDTGIKVSVYIKDAVTMNNETLKLPENIKLAAVVFKKLHSCNVDTKVSFDYLSMVKKYEDFIIKNNVPLFDDYNDIKKLIVDKFSKPAEKGETLVPCHNDPLCENWVRSGEKMYLIDWEYAGMNNYMWDLACVSIETDFTKEQDDLFLFTYFQKKATQLEFVEFNIQKIKIDFLWSLWGKTKVPYDGKEFEDYANNRYERMKRNIELTL